MSAAPAIRRGTASGRQPTSGVRYGGRSGLARRGVRAVAHLGGVGHLGGVPARHHRLRGLGRARRGHRPGRGGPPPAAPLPRVPHHPALRPALHRPRAASSLRRYFAWLRPHRRHRRRSGPGAVGAEGRRPAAAGAPRRRAAHAAGRAAGRGRARRAPAPGARRCRAGTALRQWGAGGRALFARLRRRLGDGPGGDCLGQGEPAASGPDVGARRRTPSTPGCARAGPRRWRTACARGRAKRCS